MSEVGRLMRLYRKKNPMSQGELAKKLGYSSGQFISNLERGACMASPVTILKIMDVLKVPKSAAKEAIKNDRREWLNQRLKRI